jgi:UDP-N-acetylmuramoyl-tripeptide--D-alanyl-D-alanine ligase
MPDTLSVPLWTSDEILAATGGLLMGRRFEATGISIDTRTLEPGDLFVALRGERDGHAFARDAFEKGAAGALTAQPVDGPHIEVEDTLIGLERLGLAARERCNALRGAVTGSVGKTSVTQAIKAALELAGLAHGSVKSYNNQIGVPLTLARMPAATRRAVFEIGMNHAGEIEPLTQMVRPHAVAITTVGPVHTENFADGEAGVARAKAEIFSGLIPGGPAVLNADDRWFELLSGLASSSGARVESFGSHEGCTAQLMAFEPHGGGAVVRARLRGRDIDFTIAQTGVHWGLNSLCVLLMLEALDVELDVALKALAGFQPLEGRGRERQVRLAGGAFTLIDESYNANPISMRAAIATLGARAVEGRRIAVLTDMLELGADAAARHAELAEPLALANTDLVFCAGPLMKHLWDTLPAARRAGYARTAQDLTAEVVEAVRPGDVVMVKGSNGSKAGVVAAALAGLDAPGGGA